MKRFVLPLVAAVALSAMSIVTAFAQHAMVKAGSLEITEAWTRATLPGQPAGGGFLVIENKGAEADRLVSASSALTPMTQVHEMKMEGDVMKMGELKDGLEIPAGAKVELKPGGFHIMFMGLKEGIKEGDAIKVKLVFEKAGEVEIEMLAQAPDAKGMQHGG
jgi:copper(I)-binding protein